MIRTMSVAMLIAMSLIGCTVLVNSTLTDSTSYNDAVVIEPLIGK